jgi:hypothetical protein
MKSGTFNFLVPSEPEHGFLYLFLSIGNSEVPLYINFTISRSFLTPLLQMTEGIL